MLFQKPFIKWIGGKTQIINEIISTFPPRMNNYHEIFLGGGSVLLALLSLQKSGKIIIKNKIYAYDLNKNLINVYQNVQSNKDELYKKTKYYFDTYDKSDEKEAYYYEIRNKFNSIEKNTVEHAAIFIFLNKTCFRGMYREGPRGFNVPYGHYKKTPQLLSKKELDEISELIKDVIFASSDFSDSLKNIKKGDFVYIDPPYVPIKATSFVGYTSDGFLLKNHEKLFEMIKSLQDIKFTMSNSNEKLVIDAFKDYQIKTIDARRAIHSKNPGVKAKEVLITN